MAGNFFSRGFARQSKAVNQLGNFVADLLATEEEVYKAVRTSTKEILNGLAKAGPAYSGDFRDSWYAMPYRQGVLQPAQQNRGRDGKYNLFNVPGFVQQRDARGRFTSPASNGGNRALDVLIGNASLYAEEAMDLKPGKFIRPGFEPVQENKSMITEGQRFGSRRGQVAGMDDEEGGSISTAPLDWFTSYMDAGQFTRDFKKGARITFQFNNRGRVGRRF